MSTEILESCFGLYKQLERQHSKSGFTSLLACLSACRPALLKPTTAETVKTAFTRTSTTDVTARSWKCRVGASDARFRRCRLSRVRRLRQISNESQEQTRQLLHVMPRRNATARYHDANVRTSRGHPRLSDAVSQ